MLKLGKLIKGIVFSSSILLVALVFLIFFCDLSILFSQPRQSYSLSNATKQIISFASAAVSLRNSTPKVQTHSADQAVSSANSSTASTPRTPTQHPPLSPPPSSKLEGGESTTKTASSARNPNSVQPSTSPKDQDNHTSIKNQTVTTAKAPTRIPAPILPPSNFDHKIRDFIKNNSCKSHFFFTRILPGPLFKRRDMMAVESLFKTNPDTCLVILSDVMDSQAGQEILKPITNKGYRILTISPDFPILFNNTPVLHWYEDLKKGKINPGNIPISQNLSNLLRLAALYKYGGVYIDTDIIILRNFSDLRNTVGIESYVPETGKIYLINNAVLVFSEGHPLVRMLLEDFVVKFDGSIWGNQGPHLVTRVIARVESENGGMMQVEGHNFTVLSPVAFYPVRWQNASKIFRKPDGPEEMKWVEQQTALINEKSYGLHLWNSISKSMKIQNGSMISRLYSGHCIICRNFQDLN